MWIITAIVIGAATFGGDPHYFSTLNHFETKEACTDHFESFTAQLEAKLNADGVKGPYIIRARCVLDKDGDPA